MVTTRVRRATARGDIAGRTARWAQALLVAVLGLALGPIVRAAPGESPHAAGARRPGPRVDGSGAVLPSDDWTFRPTVMIHRGNTQGSGTIIASVAGETLVLTAAHVVRGSGPITVDFYRYNLGLERTSSATGAWPRPIEARVVAIDRAADLAVLRIETLGALPYVARLAPARRDPAVESTVTSIGIDLGRHLTGWPTRLVEALWFELNDNREERLFFITAHVPQHGRSGGGLFLPDGELVGVCIGHTELIRGRRQGVFASAESIRQLLVDHDLVAVIVRSERERARPARRPAQSPGASGRDEDPAPAMPVTTTGAIESNR